MSFLRSSTDLANGNHFRANAQLSLSLYIVLFLAIGCCRGHFIIDTTTTLSLALNIYSNVHHYEQTLTRKDGVMLKSILTLRKATGNKSIAATTITSRMTRSQDTHLKGSNDMRMISGNAEAHHDNNDNTEVGAQSIFDDKSQEQQKQYNNSTKDEAFQSDRKVTGNEKRILLIRHG